VRSPVVIASRAPANLDKNLLPVARRRATVLATEGNLKTLGVPLAHRLDRPRIIRVVEAGISERGNEDPRRHDRAGHRDHHARGAAHLENSAPRGVAARSVLPPDPRAAWHFSTAVADSRRSQLDVRTMVVEAAEVIRRRNRRRTRFTSRSPSAAKARHRSPTAAPPLVFTMRRVSTAWAERGARPLRGLWLGVPREISRRASPVGPPSSAANCAARAGALSRLLNANPASMTDALNTFQAVARPAPGCSSSGHGGTRRAGRELSPGLAGPAPAGPGFSFPIGDQPGVRTGALENGNRPEQIAS